MSLSYRKVVVSAVAEAVWYAIFQQVVDEYLGACAWVNLERADARKLTEKGPAGTAVYNPVLPVERLDGRNPSSIKFITIHAEGSVPVTLKIKGPDNNGNPMSKTSSVPDGPIEQSEHSNNRTMIPRHQSAAEFAILLPAGCGVVAADAMGDEPARLGSPVTACDFALLRCIVLS